MQAGNRKILHGWKPVRQSVRKPRRQRLPQKQKAPAKQGPF
jgi:hypothetical protein